MPPASSLSSLACTVPRATPSRRDASSTPIRGSLANRSSNVASSASTMHPFAGQIAQCFDVLLHTLREPRHPEAMTTTSTHSTLTALTPEEAQARTAFAPPKHLAAPGASDHTP